MTVPAIYVFLVGPSGYGKNESIAQARKFVSILPTVPLYEGRISGPALMREIGNAQTNVAGNDPTPKLWLVTPELSFSLGEGPKAMDFIKIVTETFSMAGKSITVKDSTLTYGQATIVKPCLNWLAGTTVKWLKRSVTQDDVEAGFGSRVFMVYVEPNYGYDNRVVRPIIPENYWELRDAIQARCEHITRLSGDFSMTVAARQVEEVWYMSRPAPRSELVAAWWQREKELCLKMAMILSLCERDDLVITDRHVADAQTVVGRAGRSLELLISQAELSVDHSGIDHIAQAIRRSGVLPHERVLRIAMRQGITAGRLAEIMRTLAEAGQVRALNKQGKALETWRGSFYEWNATHGAMPTDIDTASEDV